MIARQSLLVTANSVLGAVQGYIALFVVARYMGDVVLGQRAFALALLGLGGIIARLGLPLTHARNVAATTSPALEDGGPRASLGAANGAFLRVKATLTLAFMLAGGALWYLWFEVLGKGAQDTTPFAIAAAYWIVVVQSLRDIPLATFHGLRRIVEREAILMANTLATVLLTILVGIAYAHSHGRWTPLPALGDLATRLTGTQAPMPPEHGLALLMLAMLVAEAAALVLAVGLLVVRAIPFARPPAGLPRSYLAWTIPILLLTVGEVAGRSLSQVMLGFWWDASELGQFAAAAKLSEGFLLLGGSIGVVLLPVITARHSGGDAAGARQVVRDAERWVSLLLWPLLVVVAVASDAIVHVLLSDRFARAGGILLALCAQALVLSFTIPVQQLAIGTSRSGHAARVIFTCLLVTATVDLLLIPPELAGVPLPGLGARGAALGALAGAVAGLVLYARPGGSWAGHRFLQASLAKHLAAAVATYGAFLLLPYEPVRFVTLALYAGAIVLTYLALLVALRELHRGDLRSALAMLSQSDKKA